MLIIGILIIILLGVGYYFANISLFPKTTDYLKAYEIEKSKGFILEGIYPYDYQTIQIKSDFDYNLHGLWFQNGPSKKTMIIVHGYTYNHYGSIKYMDMFIKRGFNVLLYDHRYHGKSGGKNCSFGYYEKYDLKNCVDWVKNKVGQESFIATHGESMGAATTLMHAAIDDRVDLLIADCPFESVYEQFKYRLKVEYHLPPFPVLTISNLFTRFFIKASYGQISPLNLVKHIKCPTLFIHGKDDAYIPCEHSQNLYEAKTGFKKIYLVDGADHAESYQTDKSRYEKEVHQFLDAINI